MTLKYESEILFDLMKRDGEDTPSGVLPYESELKEKYLQQVEGAYPKLQDYRSEWLNYNLVAHIPADFPVETLSNVTEATVDNVVPYAYKSAILKGQTLVNQINTITETNQHYVDFSLKYIDLTKKQLIIFNSSENVDEIGILKPGKVDWNSVNRSVGGVKSGKVILSPNSTFPYEDIRIRYNNSTDIPTVTLMVIEYQDGMENWDIPYFEGMQSVKMPVLTTTNKDGTKTNILTVNEEVELRGIGEVQDTLDCLTGELTKRIGEIVLDGSENWGTLKQGRYCIKNTLNNINRPTTYRVNFKCDKLKPITSNEEYSGTLGITLYELTNYDFIVRSDIQTIEEFKQWLSNNPTTVQYQLKTEFVKTVDLTVTDQDGKVESIIRPIEGTLHLSTSGETIKPSFSGEIPVEAITQNLASFIEE